MVEDYVYGEVFKSAAIEMQLLAQSIEQRSGIGFESEEELEAWAKEHLLDVIVYSKSTKEYYNLSHVGQILKQSAWKAAYCDVLFTTVFKKEEQVKIFWHPKGFKYYNKAKINGEKSDGLSDPLYYRDYFVPSGYFNAAKGCFNIAKPVPSFAKETGHDTSYIYTYINAIAGPCALYLLAWLRAKMINPCVKTQVVPIIVSKMQGTGKSTFGEVICKGLFGKDNVLVTDQYDAAARFNADYADALIVCQEEKDYEQGKSGSNASLKSRATATTIRKEHKGLDPVYQESYTDFILTSNREVPVKFEDNTDQRRFMVMEADSNFTRKNPVADEIFTKLYGRDINDIETGKPFVDDVDLIAQFKHELFTREDIKSTEFRKFPHTPAYERCLSLPRTNEVVDVDSTLRSLAPFIQASLANGKLCTSITLNEGTDVEEVLSLSHFVQSVCVMAYINPSSFGPAHVALCTPLVFYNPQNGTPLPHSTIERGLYDANEWLIKEYGIQLLPVMSPLPGGFFGIRTKQRNAPAARFILAKMPTQFTPVNKGKEETGEGERIGQRLRVNGRWRPDPEGEFETVNELKPGVTDLKNKNDNVAHMDTFLFEADSAPKNIYIIEQERLNVARGDVDAASLFRERLRLQLSEAQRLMNEGKACRIVYSGGKSYHVLVRVKRPPATLEEYKWIHAQLCLELSNKVEYDPSTSDPARLTRAPIDFNRTFEYLGYTLTGAQRLIAVNWRNVYDYNWHPLYEQWLNRPLSTYEAKYSKRVLPSKPEYKKAMGALLSGTFWTNYAFNGQRQKLFFPAYRLCRSLGFSHEELWSGGGIMDGLDKYYKSGDREYWRTRESCDLIKEIDRSFDE